METALLEVGLAPSCAHTDKRERKYYEELQEEKK